MQTLLHILLKAALHRLHSLRSLNLGEQTLLHILFKAPLHSLHSLHSLNFGEQEMENNYSRAAFLDWYGTDEAWQTAEPVFWHGIAQNIRGHRQPRLQRARTRNRAALHSLLARLLA